MWTGSRPGCAPAAGLLARLQRQGDELLSTLTEDAHGRRDHAVIVGYGRVGSVVGKGLKSQGLPIVVIDQDRHRVEALRAAACRPSTAMPRSQVCWSSRYG